VSDAESVAKPTSHGPPQDVSPTDLWLAMTAMPVPHEKHPFPVKDPIMGTPIGTVAMVPLSPGDMMECHKLADAYARRMMRTNPKDETEKVDDQTAAFQKIFNDEASIQVLWRAMREPRDPKLEKKSFESWTVLRLKPFTGDIIAVLLKMYLGTCQRVGPIIASMTEAEMDAWLDVLEEGSAAFPFELLSSVVTSDLLKRSAARSKALRTANASSGQAPGALQSELPKSESGASEMPPNSPPVDSPPSVLADDVVIPDLK
jgi:hypothetical protein